MPDIRDRFRAVDQVEPPDVFADALRREPSRPLVADPRRSGKAAVIAVSLFIAVVAIGFAVRAFGASTTAVGSSTPTPPPGMSVYTEPLGWTAFYPSQWSASTLQPSDGLGTGVRIQNLAYLQTSPLDNGVVLTITHPLGATPDPTAGSSSFPLTAADFKVDPGPEDTSSLEFTIDGVRYNAILHLGPAASKADVAAMNEVIASIRPGAQTSPSAAPIHITPGAVSFWDASRGLIAGDDSCASCEGAIPGAVVQRTLNGGRTWTTVFNGSPFLGLTVYGSSDAWVTTRTGVWRSTDAGANWSKVSRLALSDPTFSSPTDGWAALRKGDFAFRLVETRDGGVTWSPINSPCPRSVTGLPSSYALSKRVFMLVGLSQTGAGQGTALCSNGGTMGAVAQAIFTTTDEGQTWTQTWGGYDTVSGMQILPDGFGGRWTAPGNTYETTTDGGSTWNRTGMLPDSATAAMWLISDTEVVAVTTESGRRYHVVVSNDAGATWSTVSTLGATR